MGLETETISAEEIAAALGLSADRFRRTWRRLVADAGFPPRLPGGWRWSRPAIAAWFRAMGSVPASSADNDNSLTFEGRPDARPGSFSAATDALVAAQRGVLEDRFVHGRGIQEARSGGAATGTE